MSTRKPSEILREMPRDKWMQHDYTDGAGHFCAFGWLAKQAGAEFVSIEDDWYVDLGGRLTREPDEIAGFCGIPVEGGTWGELVELNDEHGLGAVIAALEERGL